MCEKVNASAATDGSTAPEPNPGSNEDMRRMFLGRIEQWYSDASSGLDVLADADLDEIQALVDAARP